MVQPVSGKRLLVLVGATAVGKTAVSLQLAAELGCPIISADSRQCYKELGIATAKPSKQELAVVPHFFIDSHSVLDPVSAADFEHYALQTLQKLYHKYPCCIMTGGSGLYVKAVLHGMDPIPEVPSSIRENIEQRLDQQGLDSLIEELDKFDPESLKFIDRNNPRRVIRALSVSLATGKPFSHYRRGKSQARSFEVIQVGLYRDREELYQRIDERMERMVDGGIFEEARKLYKLRHLSPLQTVGYQEVFGYLEGKYDRIEAIRLLKRNSRRYAKRQLTWFKKDQTITWFHAEDLSGVKTFLKESGVMN